MRAILQRPVWFGASSLALALFSGCTPGLTGSGSDASSAVDAGDQACAAAPGTIPLFEPCLCDRDCAPVEGGETQCIDGSCAIAACSIADPSSCPEGYACEEAPGFVTYCAECVALGEIPANEGEACGCSAECVEGLVCRGGACRRPCEDDEQCGAQACTYRVGATPSCEDPILDCLADGASAPGQGCDCNEDCGPDAPYCLLGAIDGAQIDHCTRACTTGEGGCPEGMTCCSARGVLAPTCIADALIGSIDALECDP